MNVNRFTVQLAFKVLECSACGSHIKKDTIRIRIPRYYSNDLYFHLDCFKPRLKQGISEKHITIKLSSERYPEFKEWLDNWNSKYLPIDKPVELNPIKTINSKPSKLKRTLLEIFKFLKVKDILKVNSVNKDFYQVSWEEELWRCCTLRDYGTQPVQSTWKHTYMELYTNYCIGCKTLPSQDNYYRCPLLKRPICRLCLYTNPKFKLLNKQQINCRTDINTNLLNLKLMNYRNSKVTYKFKVEKVVKKFRENNKQYLLKQLEGQVNPELFQAIQSISTSSMDKDLEKSSEPCYDSAFNYIRSRYQGEAAIRRIIKQSNN